MSRPTITVGRPRAAERWTSSIASRTAACRLTALTASPLSTATPRSSASSVSARYMRPVSTNVAPMRCASAWPTVLLPAPDGPSMATVNGALMPRSRLARQRAHLPCGQTTKLAGAQRPKRERADPGPHQPLDAATDGLEQPPNLPLPSLTDADRQPRPVLGAEAFDGGGRGPPALA